MKEQIDTIPIRKINTSKTYFTGRVFETNNCGRATIIGQAEKYRLKKDTSKNYCYYLIEFEDDTRLCVDASHIKSGAIRNPYHPTVYGVGCVGVGPWKTSIKNKDTKEYKLWHGIMERGYSKKSKERHPAYQNTTVDKRWLNFQNFCEDIQKLENYKLWKENTKVRGWDIDKDMKVPGNNIYSLETCKFVTHAENIAYSNKTGLVYLGIRINDGYQEEFKSITNFCKKYKLNQGNVSECIKGVRTKNKGWHITIKDSELSEKYIKQVNSNKERK